MYHLSPRHSIACLYNFYSPQPKGVDVESHVMEVSPISPTQPSLNDEKRQILSPVAAYYPDDKICLAVSDGIEVRQQAYSDVHPQVVPPPPRYSKSDLEKLSCQPSFWKKHLMWIITGVITYLIIISVLIGVIMLMASSQNKKNDKSDDRFNNTRNPITSTGLFVSNGQGESYYNVFVFRQNSTGDINLELSFNGDSFEASQPVTLTIPPKRGSALSSTAEQDPTTGDIMVNLFYLSGNHNITMSAITCAEGVATCTTVSNYLIPTEFPVHGHTGLAAVNVDNAEDWRVYYHDHLGFLSQLQGKSTGFNGGQRIGGQGLNFSSIAAVNVNSTTNNIRVFYTDASTNQLYTTQFTSLWTTPVPITTVPFAAWDPLSGFGAAYSSSSDQLHFFFTGLDSLIYEYVGYHASQQTNTSWLSTPTTTSIWNTADYAGADISAVGWQDNVRFFQVSAGETLMGELNNQSWSENFITP